MPPKKDTTGSDLGIIPGFELKEVKILAAAFLSSTAPDKYNYDLMATLAGNTVGSLKKMWPPIKRKAVDAHPSFGAFLGIPGHVSDMASETKAATTKANNGKKRKAPDTEAVNGTDNVSPDSTTDGDGKKKAAGRGRGRAKKAKKQASEDLVESGDNADKAVSEVEDEN